MAKLGTGENYCNRVDFVFVAFGDYGIDFIGGEDTRIEGTDVKGFLFDEGKGGKGNFVDFALFFEADELSL